MLERRVDLAAQQIDEPQDVEPSHEHDDAADRSVGGVVRAQVGTTLTNLNNQSAMLAFDQRGFPRSRNDIGAVCAPPLGCKHPTLAPKR